MESLISLILFSGWFENCDQWHYGNPLCVSKSRGTKKGKGSNLKLLCSIKKNTLNLIDNGNDPTSWRWSLLLGRKKEEEDDEDEKISS